MPASEKSPHSVCIVDVRIALESLRDTGEKGSITPEEIRAVYNNQASFILEASGGGRNGDLLNLFDIVNRFYCHWEIGRVARVEVSVKVCGKGIFTKRYAIPVNPYFEMDAGMMSSIMKRMNTPPDLMDIIKQRHGEHIRMGVGIDHDGGIKKMYFSEGEKNLYAYGFREDGFYGAKTYRMLREGNRKEAMSCIREIFGTNPGTDDIAPLFPVGGPCIVYNRFKVTGKEEKPSGYHISPPKKMKISELKRPLTQMGRLCRPDVDEREFYSWLDRMASAYLFWVGLGKDGHGGIEISLYVRNIDC